MGEGETLPAFVEAAVRAGVQRRHVNAEFVGRGLRSRDEARRSDDYVDAQAVLARLQDKLDASRRPVARGAK